jgi:molybdopterin/thiamine biosynthesis adenylyltransferase
MISSDLNEQYARQVILPAVGKEGQKKLSEAVLFVAGEGASLESALTALCTAGVSSIFILALEPFDAQALSLQFPGSKLEKINCDFKDLPKASLPLILTDNKGSRRDLSRFLRKQARPTLFGWCAGSGYALMAASHTGGQCPCFECFEIMNPKAFNSGSPTVQRLMGSMAASEALQWILKGDTPLENKVWVTSLESGVSFQHEVRPSIKCSAHLLEKGANITP